MKKLAFLSLSFFLVSTCIWAQDDEGWYKTKWGMTLDEVQSVLSQDLVRSSEGTKTSPLDSSEYLLGGYRVGKFGFDVYLLFGPDGKLSKVSLKYPGRATGECFSYLRDELIKKYGKPTAEKEEKTTGKVPSNIQTAEWLIPNTIINIARVWYFAGGSHDSVELVYEGRASDVGGML